MIGGDEGEFPGGYGNCVGEYSARFWPRPRPWVE